MIEATIVPVQDGKHTVYKLMLGVHELGTSKTDFDARFHMHAINEALNLARQEGRNEFARQVGALGPVFRDE